jgi:ribosome-binding factor A
MGRIDRINQQVKREIGRILLEEVNDPRLRFVTITEASVSKDLQNAKIFFSVLGDPSQVKAAEQGLEGAKGMIRGLLGRSMDMRYTPELFFVFDKSIEISARIDETLKEIHDEYEERHSGDQKK